MKYSIKDALIDFSTFQVGVVLDLLAFHLNSTLLTMLGILFFDTLFSVIYVVSIYIATRNTIKDGVKQNLMDQVVGNTNRYFENVKQDKSQTTRIISIIALLFMVCAIGFILYYMYSSGNLFSIVALAVVIVKHTVRHTLQQS